MKRGVSGEAWSHLKKKFIYQDNQGMVMYISGSHILARGQKWPTKLLNVDHDTRKI